MGTLIVVILAIGVGFVIGVLYSKRHYRPDMQELDRYRTWLWRSDINEEALNQPGTVFRFSLDGKKNIYRAKVELNGKVVPTEEMETDPFPYLEGPPAPV